MSILKPITAVLWLIFENQHGTSLSSISPQSEDSSHSDMPTYVSQAPFLSLRPFLTLRGSSIEELYV